jgi:hypothetical protein
MRQKLAKQSPRSPEFCEMISLVLTLKTPTPVLVNRNGRAVRVCNPIGIPPAHMPSRKTLKNGMRRITYK